MIKFGAWSITLALGSLHGLVMCSLLWRAPANRAASRWLAALLAIVVLMITPYTLGYAGFYDAWPWLTFAPFYWQLGIGPLIWLYVRQIGSAQLPPAWRWHFVPLAVQVGYYAVLFCLPLDAKWRWNDTVHRPFVAPAERALTALSIVVYLSAALQQTQRYQRWLVDHSAAREELRLGWLRGFLLAMTLATTAALCFGAVHLFVRPLDYFDEFPLYVVYTALVWYLGVEGWRHAAVRYPRVDASQRVAAATAADAGRQADPPGGIELHAPAAPTSPQRVDAKESPLPEAAVVDRAALRARAGASERDWTLLGERVRQQVIAGQWWREPELELSELARRIGTNTNYLSRALNEGLGMSFSEFINRLRVDAAQHRLLGSGEVMEIAFEVGFRSKPSFNRVFKACTGESPTAWRQARREGSPVNAKAPRLES